MTAPALQASSLAAALPNLLLAAERLAYIAAPGLHGRRRPGPGESFWQFRDWRTGDEPKQIDWRRSAMGDVLLLREQETTAQTVINLQLDTNPGMTFHSHRNLPTKLERGALLLLALGALLLRSGERVALAGITPPLTGKSALPNIAQALASGGTARLMQNARMVTFGDFLRPAPLFNTPQGGAVVQILDPAECDFPYRGRVIFEDFGAAPPLEAASATAWAGAYRTRIAAQRAEVAQAALHGGQTPLFHRTDAPPATALSALYQALQRG